MRNDEYYEYDEDFEYTEPEESYDVDDDDDILAGLESNIDEEEAPKRKPKRERRIKRERIKKEKSDTDRFEEKPRSKMQIVTSILAIAAMVGLVFMGELVISRNMNTIQSKGERFVKAIKHEETDYKILGTEYAAGRNVERTDNNVAECYRFLIEGKHKSSGDTPTGIIQFNFLQDDTFEGYSSAGEESYGTYSVYADNGQYMVATNCSGKTDVYSLDFSEQNDIMLTSGDKTYTLYSD